MTYQEAKIILADLEAKVKDANAVLRQFPKGNMGMTPDHVKASPEFQAAKKTFRDRFTQLQNFNTMFCKTFQTEYAEERKLRGR